MGPEIGTCIGIDASVVWMSSSPFSLNLNFPYNTLMCTG
jgi:hypothetical protein